MSKQPDTDFQFPTTDKPVVDNPPVDKTSARPVDEDAIDHGVEETFPASDPVSVSVSKVEDRDSGTPPAKRPPPRDGNG